MKFRLLLLILLLSALMTIPAAAQSSVTPVPSETPRGSYVVGTDIYVRGGPGESYLPVGRLVAGDTVIPVNRSTNSNWVMIHYSFGFGWIRRDLAFWAENVDALPTLDQSQLTPTSLYTPTATDLYTATPVGVFVHAGAAGARIRSGPAVAYFPVGALVTGEEVEPVGRNPTSAWILIRYRDGFGWIALSLLSGLDNVESLPVLLPGALTPSATFTATPTPTITPTPTDTSTPSPTRTPSPTLTPTDTPTLTDTATFTVDAEHDTQRHGDGDAHCHIDRYPAAQSNADGSAECDADVHVNGYAHTHGYGDLHQHAFRDSDADTSAINDAVGDPVAHFYVECNGIAAAKSHVNAEPSAQSSAGGGAHRHAVAFSSADGYAECDANGDR